MRMEAVTRFGWTTSKCHRFGRNDVPTPVQQLNFIERRIDQRSGAPTVADKDNTIIQDSIHLRDSGRLNCLIFGFTIGRWK